MALAADRDTPRREGGVRSVPVAKDAVIHMGAMVAINAAGYAKVPSAATDKVLGRAEARVSNKDGANGDRTVDVRSGVFRFENSTADDEIALSNAGSDCYAADDERVALTNGSSARPRAGRIFDVDARGVWVAFD